MFSDMRDLVPTLLIITSPITPLLTLPSPAPAEVKAVSFTGGTATGALVATAAAPLFKKVSLELGGKNAAIVLEDADIGKQCPWREARL